jgi:hypothetical protein
MHDALRLFLFAREPVPVVLFVSLVIIIAAVLAANVVEWYRRGATRPARGGSARGRVAGASIARPTPDDGRTGSSVGLVGVSPTRTTVAFGESLARAHPHPAEVNAGVIGPEGAAA